MVLVFHVGICECNLFLQQQRWKDDRKGTPRNSFVEKGVNYFSCSSCDNTAWNVSNLSHAVSCVQVQNRMEIQVHDLAFFPLPD